MGRSRSVALVVLLVVAGLVLVSRCATDTPASAPGETPAEPAPAPEPERARVRVEPPPPEEWDRELPPDVYLADLYDEAITHVPVRVVDDADSTPVEGARIDDWFEATWPHAEAWEPLRLRSVPTDVDGWALLDRSEHGQWMFVEAPGYAPFAEFGFDTEIRLQRGEDVPLEVRDWLGRPLPGVTVELLLGCGHTPAVRREVSDAEGRLVLRCIAPDRGTLWVRGDGVLGTSGYSSSPAGLPLEDGYRILVARPAPVLEGRVVNADGTPAGDVVVGVPDTHRGPWTRADADGRFRLRGAPPGEDVTVVYTWPAGADEHRETFAVTPGVFAVLRLPTVDEDGEGGEETVRVLRVSGAVTSAVPLLHEYVPLRAVRERDGRTEEADAELVDGAFAGALELPQGAWTVTAGDPSGALRPVSVAVTVESGDASVELPVTANPVWRPVVLERGPDGTTHPVPTPLEGAFAVVTPRGRHEAVHAGRTAEGGRIVKDAGAFHVPAEGRFAVEYEEWDDRVARVVLDAPPEGTGPPLVLPAPDEDEEEEEEELAGVPYAGDFPAARLTVLRPEGRPAAGARVQVSGSFQPNVHYSISSTLDAQGGGEYTFRGHDRVEVTAADDESLVPLVAYIEQPGPWTLRWPDTALAIRATGEAGRELTELEVVLGAGKSLFSDDGVVFLRGMGGGPVRFWVAAPGHVARDVRVDVVADTLNEVTVAMRPRPAAPADER